MSDAILLSQDAPTIRVIGAGTDIHLRIHDDDDHKLAVAILDRVYLKHRQALEQKP